MDFSEFDRQVPTKETVCDPCAVKGLPPPVVGVTHSSDLPPRIFIMTDSAGLAYYATTTDDGRIVPIDDVYEFWD